MCAVLWKRLRKNKSFLPGCGAGSFLTRTPKTLPKKKQLPKTQENQKEKNNAKTDAAGPVPGSVRFLFMTVVNSRIALSITYNHGKSARHTFHTLMSQSLIILKFLSSLGTARISITQSVTGLPFIPSAYSAWISKEEADSPRRIRVAATSISSRPKGVL